MKPKPTFAALIRARRAAVGLSQDALARQAGVTISLVSKIEQDASRNPSWETVQRLAAALGCSTEDLRTR